MAEWLERPFWCGRHSTGSKRDFFLKRGARSLCKLAINHETGPTDFVTTTSGS